MGCCVNLCSYTKQLTCITKNARNIRTGGSDGRGEQSTYSCDGAGHLRWLTNRRLTDSLLVSVERLTCMTERERLLPNLNVAFPVPLFHSACLALGHHCLHTTPRAPPPTTSHRIPFLICSSPPPHFPPIAWGRVYKELRTAMSLTIVNCLARSLVTH